jgi:UPF0042 nucleotide-binding protein
MIDHQTNLGTSMSDAQTKAATKIVLVTGLSGAGRSTAIRALEDLGYETIDNLPLSLLPNIVTAQNRPSQIAVGLDARNRDFSVHGMIDMLQHLSEIPSIAYDLVFVTCDNDVLVRRFSETRRRHPLAPAETPLAGIERERDLLVPIMARSDIVINSSEMSPHDLRADIARYFTTERSVGLAVSVQSFSYKRGLPRGVDMMFDCRFLNNPYWQPELRKLNGCDKDIQDYVQADPRFSEFFAKISDLSRFLLPAYTDEGKTHFSIGFGCTGGQHRSVALAELLAKALANQGWQVSIRHRELERNRA